MNVITRVCALTAGATDAATASAKWYPVNARQPSRDGFWLSHTQELYEEPVYKQSVEVQFLPKMRQKRNMNCGPLPRIRNGILLHPSPFYSRAYPQCHPGFSLVGGSLKCVRGRWRGKLPYCLPTRGKNLSPSIILFWVPPS